MYTMWVTVILNVIFYGLLYENKLCIIFEGSNGCKGPNIIKLSILLDYNKTAANKWKQSNLPSQ